MKPGVVSNQKDTLVIVDSEVSKLAAEIIANAPKSETVVPSLD